MIDGKTIKFGYGDVAVRQTAFSIILQQIKPPQKVGTDLHTVCDQVEYIGERIWITPSSLEEFNDLLNKLKDAKTNPIFEFDTYTFDFSNYNADSVVVVTAAVRAALMNYLGVIAC